MKLVICYALLLLFMVGGQGCSKKEAPAYPSSTSKPVDSTILNLPEEPYNYARVIFPQHIQAMFAFFDNTPADNPITDNGATLGRVLFYDKYLSVNNTISCGTCHKQSLGFSDGLAKSIGHAGAFTRRNSMPLLNLRFYRSGKMFWDERAGTLEEQVLLPFQDSIEMGMTLPSLLEKINSLAYYKPLFNKAFGSDDITADRISKALAQFLRSIVTYRSKYDMVKQGLASFTPQEAAGHLFFSRPGPFGACIECHGGGGANEFQQAFIPVRNPPSFENANDWGVYEITHEAADSSKFKIPSLRNVALGAPYMHNGSVATLHDMFNNNYHSFRLTEEQKENIIAFLNTLTDNDILTDPKFSDPFR